MFKCKYQEIPQYRASPAVVDVGVVIENIKDTFLMSILRSLCVFPIGVTNLHKENSCKSPQ